ncbi:hypothetical protein GGF31_008260 [Allomyces arbusculus]|nr:hypothetical protein GGF31_008260 [Allomyces arbusculus]
MVWNALLYTAIKPELVDQYRELGQPDSPAAAIVVHWTHAGTFESVPVTTLDESTLPHNDCAYIVTRGGKNGDVFLTWTPPAAPESRRAAYLEHAAQLSGWLECYTSKLTQRVASTAKEALMLLL